MADVNPLLTIDEANADEAYARVLPEAMALPQDSLLTINVDVHGAVITTIGVATKLPAHEEGLRALPGFHAAMLAKFPDYILALYSAHTRYVFAMTPVELLPELLEKATGWRDILLTEARSLVARQLVKAELLKELTGTHGFRNVAFDLSGLTQIFKSGWSQIEGNTGIKLSQLQEVDKLALKMNGAIAQREQSPARIAAATDIRLRMFTLFFNAYDEIRRGILFLRWHQNDADEIAPSIYSGRQNSNILKKNTSDGKDTSAVAPPTVPSAPSAAAQGVAKVPVGLPGSDPLTA